MPVSMPVAVAVAVGILMPVLMPVFMGMCILMPVRRFVFAPVRVFVSWLLPMSVLMVMAAMIVFFHSLHLTSLARVSA